MNNKEKREIRVRGLVQGVGFRPTVWKIANEIGIAGDVSNDAEGVLIHACSTNSDIDLFIEQLRDSAPPLSKIDSIEGTVSNFQLLDQKFHIIESRSGHIKTGVVADAATCSSCVSDISDADNRRYRYAFTNCTHCGPRLSIIRSIPYDRENTSMGVFKQCDQCLAEYRQPADRRFHAQPNACSTCGPKVWLENNQGERLVLSEKHDAVSKAAELLIQGKILTIKGVGGFHLACDATNNEVVGQLRSKKRRFHKAFALMASSIEMIKRYCWLDETEEVLLRSTAAPIVVLLQKDATGLPDLLAPGQNSLGFMLPYTPLHHLLLKELDFPIVLTSGNLSEEPQVIRNEIARQSLNQIYDYGLFHNREIENRLDDSVARMMSGAATLLRRSRGYAPEPMKLPNGFVSAPEILAMGSELKNTFCLIKNGEAIVSQHMGDLEDAGTHKDYRHNLELYSDLFEHTPEYIAVDMHPNYLSTQWGKEQATRHELELLQIQHHHAHIASCMAEHELPLCQPKVLGVAMDGLGFGTDGEIWGGEFLMADYCEFERLAHFEPIEMIGSAKAMREPWRNTYAYLRHLFSWPELTKAYGQFELIEFLESQPLSTIDQMIDKGLNVPKASSCGRLFDAVAASLNICRESVNHEGQAAITLEAIADQSVLSENKEAYSGDVRNQNKVQILSWESLWRSILIDIANGVPKETISARFHLCMINTISNMAITLCRKNNLDTVVLSGGVFQNKILLEGVVELLQAARYQALFPVKLPANDGGISLGQGVIAAAQIMNQKYNKRLVS